jgi:hypothetical protein
MGNETSFYYNVIQENSKDLKEHTIWTRCCLQNLDLKI